MSTRKVSSRLRVSTAARRRPFFLSFEQVVNSLKKRHKRCRPQPIGLCGEIGSEDGLDPREYFQSSGRSRKNDHKLMQLCRQVHETLDLVLADDGSDDLLVHLSVTAVMPAPDASQLLVCLDADPPEGTYDAKLTMSLLQAEAGRLRCEVAAAITRKRAPRLLFQVQGPRERREEMR